MRIALCRDLHHDHQQSRIIAINAQILKLSGLTGRRGKDETGELAVANDWLTVQNDGHTFACCPNAGK